MSFTGLHKQKNSVQVSDNVVALFDLLARFDYEDAQKKHQATIQAIEIGSPKTSGEPISGSCIEPQLTKLESNSFKGREDN